MKLEMTIDEALAFADEWSRGLTLYPGAQGWRVVCMLLADEVRSLQSIANSDDGAGGDGMRLYLEHRKFRTALERIERDCTARKSVMIARDALGLTQNVAISGPAQK